MLQVKRGGGEDPNIAASGAAGGGALPPMAQCVRAKPQVDTIVLNPADRCARARAVVFIPARRVETRPRPLGSRW